MNGWLYVRNRNSRGLNEIEDYMIGLVSAKKVSVNQLFLYCHQDKVCAHTTAQRTYSKLVKNGYFERYNDDGDMRIFYLRTTPKSQDYLTSVTKLFERNQND